MDRTYALLGSRRASLLVCGVLLCLGLVAVAQESRPAATTPAAGAEAKVVALPKPVTEGGKPLMEALKNRHSSRAFSPKKLSDQVLSNLLWAADGINRPEDGRRTAPSAMNWQDVDIYVIQADGAWLYDAKANALKLVMAQDLRALAGRQPFVKDAPLNLVYVADFARVGKDVSEEDRKMMSGAETGFISQNVYLYCASEGLATVVRAMIDRPALAKALNLRPEQSIILAQTVGEPLAAEAP